MATPNVTGELGGPLSGLGYLALGIADIAAGQVSIGNSLSRGLKMVPRNFKKTAYNRFFTYKATPRIFAFAADRLSRESLDSSPYITELGNGEVVLWQFDFTNMLLAGETITDMPRINIVLKRQNIAVFGLINNISYSGAIAKVIINGGNNQRFTNIDFTSMLGQPTSILGTMRLGDTPNNIISSGLQRVGFIVGGQYTLGCSVPLSSGRVEQCFLDFSIPI